MARKPLEVIQLLAENEMVISRIYRVFSERFPEYRDFWETMAAEEIQHADMIRSVVPEVKEGTVRFKAQHFDETSAGMFSDYLKFSLARAGEQHIPLKNAFETALAIEHDLIERSFFDLFEADTGELMLIFEGLASSTREHHRRLVQAVENNTESAE
jgi:rubrerythrin